MFHGLGNHVLAISSMDTIRELFDSRATINSDRPTSVSTHELMGLGQVRVYDIYILVCAALNTTRSPLR